jgi:hypothetical protein
LLALTCRNLDQHKGFDCHVLPPSSNQLA